jgi:hypothetical protein
MKKSIVLLFTALLFSWLFPSCEKEVIDYMESYYTESMGLKSVTIDSVRAFNSKVDNYVTMYPSEKEHPLYPKIKTNIKNAAFSITITCDTTWDGIINIKF